VPHAHLVDIAHVEHFHARLPDEAFFPFVHASDADLAKSRRLQGRCHAANARQLSRAVAAQYRHRHAVRIAGGRQVMGVEVGVGVQPQHAQVFAQLAAMTGHRADRANGQAVVAPQQDGHFAFAQRGMHRLMHGMVPGCHLDQVTVAADRGLPRVGRPADVAPVGDAQAVAFQRGLHSGNAKGLGAHGGAARARANVGGCAYEPDVSCHVGIDSVLSEAGFMPVRPAFCQSG